MKVWVSVTAVGLSLAPFMACSSPPTDGYTPPPGTGNAGASTQGGTGNSSAGASTQGGASNSSAGATTQGGASNGTAGSTGIAGSTSVTGGAGGATTGTEAACPAGVDGHCDANPTYPTYDGFTLKLVEDFPAAIDLDTDPILTWSDGSPADGQTRFRKEQITFSGGKMIITSQPPDGCAPATSNPGCIPAGTSYAEPAKGMTTGSVAKMGVWSGELRTKYNNYRYGRYETKYHAPAQTGGFLSTFFAFRTPKWTIWNEIDVELEPSHAAGIAGNVVFGPQGYMGYPGDPAQNDAWSLDNVMLGGQVMKISDEHVYAFTWLPTGITWYADGNMVQSFAGKAQDTIPTASAKIMMNMWQFNDPNTFGDDATNQYPIHSEYEYFHFYKWNNETTYPCSPAPSCLPPADLADSQNNPSEMNYGH
jgi:hypothetical protein